MQGHRHGRRRFRFASASDAGIGAKGQRMTIEFLVRANTGQAPKAAKVTRRRTVRASASRVKLAAAPRHRRSAWFRRGDAGIGARGGKNIFSSGAQCATGEKPRAVLCVLHSPRDKWRRRRTANIRVNPKLSDGKNHGHCGEKRGRWVRRNASPEIARMLGGRRITEQARAHAREMLAVPHRWRTQPQEKARARERR